MLKIKKNDKVKIIKGKDRGKSGKVLRIDGQDGKGSYEITIKGHSKRYGVSNITFENVSWFGKKLRKDSPGVRVEDNTNDIIFR